MTAQGSACEDYPGSEMELGTAASRLRGHRLRVPSSQVQASARRPVHSDDCTICAQMRGDLGKFMEIGMKGYVFVFDVKIF